MKKETQTAVYDEELGIEAYRFRGMMQPFPNHFHSYYVIGYIEDGERCLSCQNQNYAIKKGHIVLFNPGDNHACVQSDNGTLNYRSFNLSKEVMLHLAEEITGTQTLPIFSQNVIFDEEVNNYLYPLHEMVMNGSREFDKEEYLILLLSLLIHRYGHPFDRSVPECREEIERAWAFMEQHFAERISLEQICYCAGLSKSTLLRAFTKSKGITPYCYLENIRIGAAKRLLEQGIPPIQVALQTGFSDQSHFTNYFSRLIGLTPGSYREMFLGRDDGEGKSYGT